MQCIGARTSVYISQITTVIYAADPGSDTSNGLVIVYIALLLPIAVWVMIDFFASIPKEEDPMSVTFDRAVEIIIEKKEADAKKVIKLFPENEDVQLLNGRWGPYLKIGKKNFKLPKDVEPEKLSLEECITISENQPVAKKKKAVKNLFSVG